MTDFDLVILDCDGVLIDSEVIACAADAVAYQNLGFEISTEDVMDRFAGMSDKAVQAIVEKELGRPLSPGFYHDIELKIMDKYKSDLQAIDGAKEFLSNLCIKKCVASSSSPTKLALGLILAELYGNRPVFLSITHK